MHEAEAYGLQKAVARRGCTGVAESARATTSCVRPPIPWSFETRLRALDGELVVDDQELAVVEQIIEWAKQGTSLAKIARKLNAEGVRSR